MRDATQNFVDAQAMFVTRNLHRWKATAEAVDNWCRLWVPLTYLTLMRVLLSCQFYDDYNEEASLDEPSAMFQGFGYVSMTTDQLGRALVIPILGVCGIIGYRLLRRRAIKSALIDTAAMRRLSQREDGKGATIMEQQLSMEVAAVEEYEDQSGVVLGVGHSKSRRKLNERDGRLTEVHRPSISEEGSEGKGAGGGLLGKLGKSFNTTSKPRPSTAEFQA
jgi:hypothetical protein